MKLTKTRLVQLIKEEIMDLLLPLASRIDSLKDEYTPEPEED